MCARGPETRAASLRSDRRACLASAVTGFGARTELHGPERIESRKLPRMNERDWQQRARAASADFARPGARSGPDFALRDGAQRLGDRAAALVVRDVREADDAEQVPEIVDAHDP